MPSLNKEQFQREFAALLVRERVPEKAREYYQRHLEHWGRALRQRRHDQSMKDFLDGYFNQMVHTKNLPVFMVMQALDAVRLAHDVLLQESWAGGIDWEGMRVELGEDPGALPAAVVVETIEELEAGWTDAGLSAKQVESMGAMVRVMREGNYAFKTEQGYVQWVVRLMKRMESGELPAEEEAREFLSHLAVEARVVVATQKQALNAMMFYMKRVRGMDEVSLGDFHRARVSKRLPVVLGKGEVARLLEVAQEEGRRSETARVYWLMLAMMYASGLRVMECVRLRVKDIDFENGYVVVRQGKGNKDYPRFQRGSALCLTAPPQSC
jgi:site-specific recombinase XerD